MTIPHCMHWLLLNSSLSASLSPSSSEWLLDDTSQLLLLCRRKDCPGYSMFLGERWLAVLVVRLSLWVELGITGPGWGKEFTTVVTISGISTVVNKWIFCRFSRGTSWWLFEFCIFFPVVALGVEAEFLFVVQAFGTRVFLIAVVFRKTLLVIFQGIPELKSYL